MVCIADEYGSVIDYEEGIADECGSVIDYEEGIERSQCMRM